jgi:hypothetical protein
VTFVNVQAGPVPTTITRPPANTVYIVADQGNPDAAFNANFTGSNGRVESAYMSLGICTAPRNLAGKTAHETGHQFGLGNADSCPSGSSIMAPSTSPASGDVCNSTYPNNLAGPRDCDMSAVLNSGAFDPPPPTPTPTPVCVNEEQQAADCAAIGGQWLHASCFCQPPDDPTVQKDADPACSTCLNNGGAWCFGGVCGTPVLLDTGGDGFRLTGAAGGVLFDRDATGTPLRTAWTAAGTDDAWLALDRDGDGRIGDGTELFGDKTPQAPSPAPNGFLALAEFDGWGRGGNADGRIDQLDVGYYALRLWLDSNHDGVSAPGELHALASLGVASVSLEFRESRRRDRHGNWFQYRARVEAAGGARVGPWAYDVWLRTAP